MTSPLSSALGPTAFDQGLDMALAKFQAILNDTQRQKLQDMRTTHSTTDEHAVNSFAAELDVLSRQKRSKSTASRLHKFLLSVAEFCTIMTEGKPCNIADTFISSNPEIAALVWGSVKLTMTIITNAMSYGDGVFNLLMDITKFCPIVSEYRFLYPESTQLQKSLDNFYAAIIHCYQRLVEVTQRRGYVHFARSLTKPIYQEFRQDLDDIQKCQKNVTDAVFTAKAKADLRYQQLQVAEREKASDNRKAQNRFFSSTKSDLHRISVQQMQASNTESARRRQQLLDSLSMHDFRRPFKQANEKRFGNTTSWVFEADQFRQWLSGDSFILWCTGKIGSGKTVIASSVIQHILNLGGSLGHFVSFFFAQYDDTSSLDSYTILSCLLRQILQRTKISKATECRIKFIVASTSTRELCELLCEIVPTLPKCYFVIDGVEQCERHHRKALIEALSVLISSTKNTFIFLSSRGSMQDELLQKLPALQRLTLDCIATDVDIATYISGFINERLEDNEWIVGEPSLVDDVKTALEKGAQGMFLWAFLQPEDICRQHCDDDIRHSLDNLPEDLGNTYLRALQRVTDRRQGDAARKVFPWIAGAKRPLSLNELREAIAVRIGQQYGEPGRLYNDIRNVSSWCENLIQVDEESQVVQFAHSTVKDFLLKEPSTPVATSFHICLNDVDHELGEICVTYVNFNDFKRTLAVRPKPVKVDPSKITPGLFSPGSTGARLVRRLLPQQDTVTHDLQSNAAFQAHTSRSGTTSLEEGHPFIKYASVNWISHTACFQETTSKMWSFWKSIVKDGHDIAQRPWNGFSIYAMWDWALGNRHYALIQLLLTETPFTHASLNGEYKRQLLPRAIEEGDDRVLNILLEVSWQQEALDEGLKIASKRGQLKMVERLLAAEADVNAKPSESGGRTALQATAGGGHIDVVERLSGSKG